MENSKDKELAAITIFKFLESEESKLYNLTSQQCHLLMTLAHMIGKKNDCWPTQDYLNSITRISLATIKRSLSDLKNKGLINVVNKKKHNYYSINITSQLTVSCVEKIVIAHSELHNDESQLTVSYETQSHSSHRAPNISIQANIPIKENIPNTSDSQDCANFEKQKMTKPKNPKQILLVKNLPDWLDEELWVNFLQFRKDIKSPMTDRAQHLAIEKLKKLKDEGQDVQEIIKTSIINGWKGLFPIRNQTRNGGFNGSKSSFGSKSNDMEEGLRRAFSGDERTEKIYNPYTDSFE